MCVILCAYYYYFQLLVCAFMNQSLLIKSRLLLNFCLHEMVSHLQCGLESRLMNGVQEL